MRTYIIILADDGETIEKIMPTGRTTKDEMYQFLSSEGYSANSVGCLEVFDEWADCTGYLESTKFQDLKNFLQRKTADPSGTSVFLFSKKDGFWYHSSNLLSEALVKITLW